MIYIKASMDRNLAIINLDFEVSNFKVFFREYMMVLTLWNACMSVISLPMAQMMSGCFLKLFLKQGKLLGSFNTNIFYTETHRKNLDMRCRARALTAQVNMMEA